MYELNFSDFVERFEFDNFTKYLMPGLTVENVSNFSAHVLINVDKMVVYVYSM